MVIGIAKTKNIVKTQINIIITVITNFENSFASLVFLFKKNKIRRFIVTKENKI